ncbi:MAG: TolC family protein [Candidatus Dadabacteria bacterium]|nr:TolC family protein [Candidatus Dadabacteria bacterium]MYI73463.1 TolC family protein [Candidatus Dadabacteria bacterium]
MSKRFRIFLVFAACLLFASVGAQALTLTQAKIMALEKNHDVRVWMLGVDAARGEYKSKRGVYDPEISFMASYADTKTPVLSAFIEDGIVNAEVFSFGSELSGKLPTGTFYKLYDLEVSRTETDSPLESLSPSWAASLGFSVGQELLRGFDIASNRVSVVLSRKNRDISVYEFELMVAKTLFDLERSYWGVVAAAHDRDLEKKAYDLALDLERRTRIKVEVGVLPRVALTQARSESAARKVRMINSENAYEASMDALKNLLVIPLEESVELLEVTDSMPTAYEPPSEAVAVVQAFENRPEMRRAEREMEKAQALKTFYSRQRLPRLTVEGRLEYLGLGGSENPDRLVFGESGGVPRRFTDSSHAYDSIVDRDFPSWSVTGKLSFPIFGRKAGGNYAKARADYDRSVISYQKQKDTVRLDVRNAIREIASSQKRMEAALLSTNLAKEVLGNEEEKFKAGLSTTRELLEAQRDLIGAESSYISAFASHRVALADLERARGTMIESNYFLIENHSDIGPYLEVD